MEGRGLSRSKAAGTLLKAGTHEQLGVMLRGPAGSQWCKPLPAVRTPSAHNSLPHPDRGRCRSKRGRKAHTVSCSTTAQTGRTRGQKGTSSALASSGRILSAGWAHPGLLSTWFKYKQEVIKSGQTGDKHCLSQEPGRIHISQGSSEAPRDVTQATPPTGRGRAALQHVRSRRAQRSLNANFHSVCNHLFIE